MPKPSEIHAKTLKDVSAWYSKVGVTDAYKQYKEGKITMGQYTHVHQYAKEVMKKAMKQHRANPHLEMGLTEHADKIHTKNQEKAKAAAEKKPGAKK